MGSSSFTSLLRCRLFLVINVFVLLLPLLSHASHDMDVKGVDLEHPALDVSPIPIAVPATPSGIKEIRSCERIQISGQSRWKLGSYASSFRVTVTPSAVIPERLHSKIQICFHQNASLDLCHCETDDWKNVRKGLWSGVMSPYGYKYVDIQFTDISGSVIVAVEEDPQHWRLLFLAVGFVLLLSAPVFSSWVPFYYSTSMFVGVLLVIMILLFQGMKLLPTGRKNLFYLAVVGPVLGLGSVLLHQFSAMVNSILTNFGLSEEMHNPVSLFLLVGITIAGAALGFWMVRKFVISKDGSVDVGVAQFVKWAMRIIAVTFIFQSTLDFLLFLSSLISCWAVCSLIHKWWYRSSSGKGTGMEMMKHNQAEFLSKSPKLGSRGKLWISPKRSYAWSDSPVKGVISPSTINGRRDYYSTFHKIRKRKKFTKKEWEEFTDSSTRQAVAGLAASPEFSDWIVNNADRIQLVPDDDGSSDEGVESGTDSPDEYNTPSAKQFSLSSWFCN